MSKIKHKVTSVAKTVIDAKEMQVGQIGIIRDANQIGGYVGLHLMRTYSNFVALDQPGTTWTPAPNFKVELLEPGTTVTLTVGK